MKINWKKLDVKKVAALICEHLKKNNVVATLVGGACVSIYTKNKYVSLDLDYVCDAGVNYPYPKVAVSQPKTIYYFLSLIIKYYQVFDENCHF